MKKGILSILSLTFLFTIVIISIVVIGVILKIEFLWVLFGVWLLGDLWAIVIAFSKNRRADVKLRWIMFLIFVPFIGLTSYIFFGRKYHLSVNKTYKYKSFKKPEFELQLEESQNAIEIIQKHSPNFSNTFQMQQSVQHDLVYDNSQVTLLNNASEAWIRILEDLDSAKEYILINYYIVDDGELYRNLKKLLIKKAKQGVKIYFIYDFVGSFTKLNRQEQRDLRNSGIQIHSYMPMYLPFLNWKSNYRDHRKDISIDGRIGYTGGSNIADEYINKSIKFGFWNDEQIRIVGSAVQGIEKIFANDWKFITKTDLTQIQPWVGIKHPLPVSNDQCLVQVVASGPNHPTYAHFDILMKLIAQARKRIWLSTPYLVPPAELLEQLRVAALSGIDVRLVLPGLTDKAMLLDISERYAENLFNAGVKIYSMNSTFNHTKAYLIDDEISFIGTTNLDFRAFFADQQTMALIYGKDFNDQLKTRFEKEFSLSTLHSTSLTKNKSWWKRTLTVLLAWASPLL